MGRQARELDEYERSVRKAIGRAAAAPTEIQTVITHAIAVVPAEGQRVSIQVVKADGKQLHIQLQPDARKALVRALEAVDEEAEDGSIELPG